MFLVLRRQCFCAIVGTGLMGHGGIGLNYYLIDVCRLDVEDERRLIMNAWFVGEADGRAGFMSSLSISENLKSQPRKRKF